MSDEQIMHQIKRMIEEEHQLRDSRDPDKAARVKRIEEDLDVCWDLLRQRRAARETGGDAEHILARPVEEVERYQQ